MSMLEDKVAIVTGAGNGVGEATAIRFAAEGAKVLVADIDLEGAKATVAQIEAAGGEAVAGSFDVSDEAAVAAMFDAAVTSFGRVDILVNNVGIATPRPMMLLEEHTVEDFERLTAVNLRSVFLGTKQAMLLFKEQGGGGSIVNTGSVAGLVAWGGSVYGATKGAVHQLTKAAAIEGAKSGIRVNAICPAAMPLTKFMAGTFTEEQMQRRSAAIGAQHPLGNAITALDCAEAIVFLASNRAANLTGVLLPVDGGYVAQ